MNRRMRKNTSKKISEVYSVIEDPEKVKICLDEFRQEEEKDLKFGKYEIAGETEQDIFLRVNMPSDDGHGVLHAMRY